MQNREDVLEVEGKPNLFLRQGLEDISKFGQDTHLGVVSWCLLWLWQYWIYYISRGRRPLRSELVRLVRSRAPSSTALERLGNTSCALSYAHNMPPIPNLSSSCFCLCLCLCFRGRWCFCRLGSEPSKRGATPKKIYKNRWVSMMMVVGFGSNVERGGCKFERNFEIWMWALRGPLPDATLRFSN